MSHWQWPRLRLPGSSRLAPPTDARVWPGAWPWAAPGLAGDRDGSLRLSPAGRRTAVTVTALRPSDESARIPGTDSARRPSRARAVTPASVTVGLSPLAGGGCHSGRR